ncbi:hypothetical protein DUNSADRAFT_9738 [Dunaliella salina]|uniref:SET domain-containing protein n=1 Tax=Dunaliella salina TaxID=3046 RepID=A0ABQ7GGU7_DUNSA|nr:hypothetical protein DUNSADRAFT_9738 [Dunaliella salina]|eukprot:KAF5833829.1 hypothetical protein DUNSADRAFT_9738 [Dunaliella salina]
MDTTLHHLFPSTSTSLHAASQIKKSPLPLRRAKCRPTKLLPSTSMRSGVALKAQAPTAQQASTATCTPDQDPSELLRDLAGEELSFVAMAPTALGRGLVTREPVIRQAIVSVPMHNSLCLTDEPLSGISVFGDRLQQAWQQQHGQMPQEMQDFLQGEERWDIRMTGWLLYVLDKERQRAAGGSLGANGPSLWSQYLALLPSEHEMCCLLNYSQEEAKELQLQQLMVEAKVQREWSEYCHSYYFSKASGLYRFADSMEDSIWAASMVRSRTFSENVNGEGITLMVPYADLANHSFSHNSTFCVGQSRQNFELRSVVHIDKGVEAAISYGEAKCNYQLLRDYGFVVPGNPNDRIPLHPSVLSFADDNSNNSSSSSSGGSEDESCLRFSNAEESSKAVFKGHRLNGLSLVEAAGLAGDWMKGELYPQGQCSTTSQPHQSQNGSQAQPGQATSSTDSDSGAGSSSTSSNASSNAASSRWSSKAGDDAFWSRQRCAVLSLPLTDGYNGRAGAGAAAEDQGGGGLAKSIMSWMAKPITDSGQPPPRALRPDEVSMERASVQEHIQHMEGLLQSLPTTVEEDQALLEQHAAAADQRLSERLATAVRCRLEWKLLVRQGLHLLQAYLECMR